MPRSLVPREIQQLQSVVTDCQGEDAAVFKQRLQCSLDNTAAASREPNRSPKCTKRMAISINIPRVLLCVAAMSANGETDTLKIEIVEGRTNKKQNAPQYAVVLAWCCK